jgi:hypothetical protein
VDVHVDGVFHGRAEWGWPRPDVGELFPGPGHSFCAFGYVLDTRTLSAGTHTVEVVIVDTASHRAALEARTITVVRDTTSRARRIPLTPIGA